MWSYTLKKSGYYCSSGGKVHHSFRGLPYKLNRKLYSDETKGLFGKFRRLPPEIETTHFGGHRDGIGLTNPDDDEILYDTRCADSAIEFLQSYDKEMPFYREVGFSTPHGPHITPARFKEMYDAANITLPSEWANGFDVNAYSEQAYERAVWFDEETVDWWQKSVRNYFSSYTFGDYQLGRVLDALEASPHANNTIIVFLTDHGFHLGNKGRFMKSTLWEQVVNVPLIIHDPDRPVGQNIDDPVGLIDVGPTVLDFAGLPPLSDTIGRSLRPLMAGGRDPDRAILTVYRKNASVRKGGFRLIRYEDGSTQLYDLNADFWQLRDLGADHPAFGDMYAALVDCGKASGLDISEAAQRP